MRAWKKNGYRRTRTDRHGNKSNQFHYRKIIGDKEVEQAILAILKGGWDE